MGTQVLKNRFFACAGVALLLSAGCSMAPNRPNMAAPGSTWVAEVRNTGSFGNQTMRTSSRSAGEQTWQGRKVFVYENLTLGTKLVTEPESGRWIAIAKGDAPTMSWNPSIGWDFPLEVGKTGTRKYQFTNHANKQVSDYESTWRVEAFEDVSVPAGTFKAYKVVTSDTLGNQNVTWWSPELSIFVKANNRRTAKHPLGAGTNDTELVSQAITLAQ